MKQPSTPFGSGATASKIMGTIGISLALIGLSCCRFLVLAMSHFTTIKVEIRNGEILHQVLQELGYRVERHAKVRGYQGRQVEADYVIRQSNGYDLGFRQDDDRYELVADFWGAKIDQRSFIDSINQKYAHKMLMITAKEQGFDIETEEVLSDGTVRIVVAKWT